MGKIVMGGLLLAIGLLHLFARDFVWGWTALTNSIQGRASKRTDNWEDWTRWMGLIFVFLGIVTIASNLGSVTEKDFRVFGLSSVVAISHDANGSTTLLKNGTYQQVLLLKNGGNYTHSGLWKELESGYELKDYIIAFGDKIDAPEKALHSTFVASESFFNN